MKYREAKQLHKDDQVIRKTDDLVLIVSSIEVYGQYKKVRLNCFTEDNISISLFHDEVK